MRKILLITLLVLINGCVCKPSAELNFNAVEIGEIDDFLVGFNCKERI